MPIDIRVTDGSGEVVTDLQQSEFRVFEDGVPQTIRHFAFHDNQTELADRPAVLSPGMTPSVAGRIFLFVLGRGNLQGPVRGLDALERFIKDGLLASDRIALMAYDRVTEITDDRAAVLRLLERYRQHHVTIESYLTHWFSGLTFVLGNGEIPASVQDRIDAVFEGPDLPELRRLAFVLSPVANATDYSDARTALGVGGPSTPPTRNFVYNTEARHDLERLFGGIELIRHLAGDRHLIFVSEHGVSGFGRGAADRLAATAADARVTISPIATGGVPSSWARDVMAPIPMHQALASSDARSVAEQTGGIASNYQDAERGLKRLDQSTRSFYTIGYYPATSSTGAQRTIKVEVTRPGTNLSYRRTYYARRETTYSRRDLMADSRIGAASGYRLEIGDIPVRLEATVQRPGTMVVRTEVHLIVEPSSIKFLVEDGRHVAALDVAIYLGSERQKVVAEVRKRIDLRLEPSTYASLASKGVTLSATLESASKPKYAKVVVYDFLADRVGSSVGQIK